MRTLLFLLVLLSGTTIWAQKNSKLTRVEYVDLYKDLAIQEMKRTGIPASITLAQGLLESGNGNSRLAVKANNHFGIKCHDWKGPSVRHDDDARNECFRKYKSPEQSYIDHSDFLTSKGRYSSLFELKEDDYKAWAKGLKKAGYATSPTYSKALITIIEENQLYYFDQQVLAGTSKSKFSASETETVLAGRKLYYNNRVKYIKADSSDTYERLSEVLHLFSWQLPKYNETSFNRVLKQGEYVYVQPKRNKAQASKKTHKVKRGETLHSISQVYAIKESKLRTRNQIPAGSEPKVGVVIVLRGKLTGKIPVQKVASKATSKESEPESENEFEVEFEL